MVLRTSIPSRLFVNSPNLSYNIIKSWLNFKRHYKNIHPKIQLSISALCTLCNRAFSSLKGVGVHMKREHDISSWSFIRPSSPSPIMSTANLPFHLPHPHKLNLRDEIADRNYHQLINLPTIPLSFPQLLFDQQTHHPFLPSPLSPKFLLPMNPFLNHWLP